MADQPQAYNTAYAYPHPATAGMNPMYTQPTPGMPIPPHMAMQPSIAPQVHIPPGLQYLTQVDQLLIHQKVEGLEAFTGWETQNKYAIKNTMGQKIYFAGEESDFCSRACCGSNREFSMKIVDNNYHEVISLYRPMACLCESGPTEVSAPPGHIIGYITQEINIAPRFKVKSPAMEPVLRIEGPLLTMSLGGDVNFKVLTADSTREIGAITKQWGGLAREMFTDADHFSVSFPMDLDVSYKAVLMAAVFLIDFRCFENNN